MFMLAVVSFLDINDISLSIVHRSSSVVTTESICFVAGDFYWFLYRK